MSIRSNWTEVDIYLNEKELNYINIEPSSYNFIVNNVLIRWMKESNNERVYKKGIMENNGKVERMQKFGRNIKRV